MPSCCVCDSAVHGLLVVVWSSGSALVLISKVNLHRAGLVLGWVTVSGFSSRCLGSVNEDQLWLGRKRQVWFIPLVDVRGVCR